MVKPLKSLRAALRRTKRRSARKGGPDPSVFEKKSRRLRETYPRYEIGRGTYGVPAVHEYEPGHPLRIGSFCSIGRNVQLYLGGNHRMACATTYPLDVFLGVPAAPGRARRRPGIVIGNDVWIGSNAVILSGVIVGDGAVVGNSAVVTRDVPPYAVVAGNPARLIRYRFAPGVVERLLAVAWWDWPDEEIEAAVGPLTDDDIEAFLAYAERRADRG